MQVRSLKPINLAVLAALATIVASVSTNTEAAPLLNYKSDNTVESALGDAKPGTTGFLNLESNVSETYSGENAEVDSLTFINKTEGTNSLVFYKGRNIFSQQAQNIKFLN